MNESIPSAAEVAAALAQLTFAQLGRLAYISGVPLTTVYKIKSGETTNPGIETVRKFAPFIAQAQQEEAA